MSNSVNSRIADEQRGGQITHVLGDSLTLTHRVQATSPLSNWLNTLCAGTRP